MPVFCYLPQIKYTSKRGGFRPICLSHAEIWEKLEPVDLKAKQTSAWADPREAALMEVSVTVFSVFSVSSPESSHNPSQL